MGGIFSKPKLPKVEPVKVPTKEESAKELDESHQKNKRILAGQQGRKSTILSRGVQGDDSSGVAGLATKTLLGG